MQSKKEIQNYILDLVNIYNSFYKNIGDRQNIISQNYNKFENSFRFKNNYIPLLSFIQQNLYNIYNIRTTWSKKSNLYIINYNNKLNSNQKMNNLLYNKF
jgi:hypothetical protein